MEVMARIPGKDGTAGVQRPAAGLDGTGADAVRGASVRGVKGPVGEGEVKKAAETYRKYKDGLAALHSRVVGAEEWWKNNHWERFESGGEQGSVKPVSAWLFNSIINKHADFMDNYPMPAILPREKSDEGTAKLLTDVVPVVMEQNGFAKTYNEASWDKPKTGTAVYAVLWDPQKENGLGDIEITGVDILNLVWQPGVDDIQDSRNLFVTQVMDLDVLRERYPYLPDGIKGGMVERPKYNYEEQMDETGKVVVYDWYYKREVRTEGGGSRTVLHYCKFVDGHVIYASANDPEYALRGWYDHGKYPFVLDVQFLEKGSPAGFGYLDVMVNPQEYIDRLDQVILQNALMNRPRYFASNSTNVDLDKFTDLSQDIVPVMGDVSEDRLRQITPPQISDIVFTQRDSKINELKETSGNRDFSQGSTASGVTAASAIAALQEAGSKLSRDMIKNTYTAYEEVVLMVIELIRQFYDMPRCYRITRPNGTDEYVEFTNEGLAEERIPGMPGEGLYVRRPVFDIRVSAQKASPYSRIANNELAKELFQMGVFNPQLADQAKAVVSMMDFDRRDEVLKIINENGTMYEELVRMQQTVQQMAELIYKTTGDASILDALAASGAPGLGMTETGAAGQSVRTDQLGRAVNADTSTAGKARERVNGATEVRS